MQTRVKERTDSILMGRFNRGTIDRTPRDRDGLCWQQISAALGREVILIALDGDDINLLIIYSP